MENDGKTGLFSRGFGGTFFFPGDGAGKRGTDGKLDRLALFRLFSYFRLFRVLPFCPSGKAQIVTGRSRVSGLSILIMNQNHCAHLLGAAVEIKKLIDFSDRSFVVMSGGRVVKVGEKI